MKRTKLIVCVLFLVVVLLLGSKAAHASSDIGFIIKKDTFSLTVRFGFAELDAVDVKSADEITNAGRLFFDCIRWVHLNQKQLGRSGKDIIVWWDLENRSFGIQDKDEMAARQVKYRTGNAAEKLLRTLEKILRLSPGASAGPASVPLHIVRSEEYIDTWHLSDIYFGSIPSYMYSYSEEKYVFLMWSWDPASLLAKDLRDQGATVELADITRVSMYGLLGNLE